MQEPNLKVVTPSSMLNEKCKKLEIIGSSEPRRIQRVRKEKTHRYRFYFYWFNYKFSGRW